MSKKIRIGLGIFAAVVIILVIVIALQPSTFRVARSATMSAPPAVAFAQVNDFHKWVAWNPFAKLDPAAKSTFEGAPAGVGAITTWSGNDKIGEGRMTIVESKPGELVRIKLEFMRPMAGTSEAQFAFKPEGNNTVVTWSMSGDNNFMAKAIHLVMNMDKMVGGSFEAGLKDMKAVAEAAAKK